MKRLLLIFCLLTNFAFASEQTDLEKYVQKWAPQFLQSDWKIQVIAVPESDLILRSGNLIMGASTCDVDEKTETILVASRDSYSIYLKKVTHIRNVKRDQENTVIHEMLHCVWRHAREEGAIQMVSEAIKPSHKLSLISKLHDKLFKVKPLVDPDEKILDKVFMPHDTIFTIPPDLLEPPAAPEPKVN